MPNLLLGMEFWLILRFLKSMIFDEFVDFVDFMNGRKEKRKSDDGNKLFREMYGRAKVILGNVRTDR